MNDKKNTSINESNKFDRFKWNLSNEEEAYFL